MAIKYRDHSQSFLKFSETVAASAVEIKDRTGKLIEMVPVADVLARIEKLTSG